MSAADGERTAPSSTGRPSQETSLFRLLVERVVDYAIFLLTPDGQIASWNLGAQRLKGYAAHEIIGQSFERFYTPEDQLAGLPRQLLAIARRDGRVESEGWRVRKDGVRFWADVIITALRDETGALVGFAKVTRDLTERRQADLDRARGLAATRAAERLDRLQAASARLAGATKPLEVAEVVANIAIDALQAARVLVAFPQLEDADALETLYAEGQAADEGATIEAQPMTHVYRTGRALFATSMAQLEENEPQLAKQMRGAPDCAWAVVPLVLDQRVLGVVGLRFEGPRAIDADERGLLRALAAVAAQAFNRASLFQSEQTARSQAEAAVRAQDEFLSIASHELRTPVATVKAAAQLAQRAIQRNELDPARVLRHLESIAQGADRLSLLVDDLLDVSRLRTGQLRLRLQRLDLREVVREVVSRHAESATTAHQLTHELPEEALWVEADPLRIEQVLDNLLSNAIKYSPDGGGVHTVASSDAEGVTVLVSDQGIGLPAGHETHIFEPFGRAPNAALEQISGLGLGLAICRQLIDAHGGRIWATSPGEQHGTTIGFWLPRLVD